MTGKYPGWLNEENLDEADSRPPSEFKPKQMPELPDYLKEKPAAPGTTDKGEA